MGDGKAGILGTIKSSQNLAYARCASRLFEYAGLLPSIRLYIPGCVNTVIVNADVSIVGSKSRILPLLMFISK